MHQILSLSGQVKYTITLDPSVWIFDDRKMEIGDYFSKAENPTNEEDYTNQTELGKQMAKPPIKQSVKKYRKNQWLTDSFVIPAKPFIENAEPLESAGKIIFELKNDERYELPLEDAKEGVFAFSSNGKALKEDGPIHFYYGDGSNRSHPVKGIIEIIVG
ncbi:hypothetical protein EV207_10536 [Scopulibacillus darangshiensis]|uniref:Peptidyl-prolyl cis-trans isomerase n=1 Tax=Scopulibacillus darangshiensis TaxID=442528 RepID=A0A4R2P6W5_9BACL|nr:peptidyl-prolyl cis-trans isomerase [Scopulibacillus darangshiensis]TCP30507.1 hypothetical protein EV207_10536 [Scopulibacillus darangshiensis]